MSKITKDIDPTGKNRIFISIEEDLSHHWNKQERIKWTITYFAGIFLVYAVRTSMSICAPAMAIDLGWNKQISGMALSAFFCGYVTTNILGGYLADTRGGEIVIFYASLGWSTMTILLPIVSNSNFVFYSGTVSVLVTRFLTGVFQGVFFPSVLSIIAKHVAVSERGFLYSFAYSGSSVGTIATGFAGSLIIEYTGWAHVFILAGLISMLWAIWFKYLYTIQASKLKRDPQKTTEKQVAKEPVPWKKLASCPPVWALIVSYFCSSYCFYNLLSWTPVYFHEAFPQSKGWVFNVIPWLLNFITTNISGYITNILIAKGVSITFVRKFYASLMFLSMSVLSLMLNSVETFHQALLVMSMNIAVTGFSTSSISLNSQDLAPNHAGSLHGVMNCCGASAGFVGVYITGYILETTQKWSSVFFITSLVSFVGFLTYLIFGSGARVV